MGFGGRLCGTEYFFRTFGACLGCGIAFLRGGGSMRDSSGRLVSEADETGANRKPPAAELHEVNSPTRSLLRRRGMP
jgi:hypothetical protein